MEVCHVKRIISLGLLVSMLASCFLLLPSFAKKHGGKTSSVTSISATITGNVTLLAKRKTFPTDLAELYAGNDSAVTFNKKGKKINVSGSYTGGNSVTVNESSATAEAGAYSFDMPVIQSILETFSSTLSKDSSKTGLITARFTDTISKTISITNVVTSREGNNGKVSGSFTKAGASGRFALNFKFE
jgi:hypothetical protein